MDFYSSEVIARLHREAVTLLEKHVPTIKDETKNWETFLEVLALATEMHTKKDRTPDELTIMLKSMFWLRTQGEETYKQNPGRIAEQEHSYEEYVLLIDNSDWKISKDILLNMPERLIEQYLIEEIPKLDELNRPDTFKAISQREKDFGLLPKKWLMKAYGNEAERNNG